MWVRRRSSLEGNREEGNTERDMSFQNKWWVGVTSMVGLVSWTANGSSSKSSSSESSNPRASCASFNSSKVKWGTTRRGYSPEGGGEGDDISQPRERDQCVGQHNLYLEGIL